MLIDWFTVIAQAVNFLILVWLLKRFLYRPILDAIDAREQGIAKKLKDAEAKKTEARQERDEFRRKNEEFDKQRDALLQQAAEEAKIERQRLLDEARQAADTLSMRRRETLENDAKNLNQAIMRRTQQEVLAIARKMLADLAATSLETRMVEVFVIRLRETDNRSSLAGAFGKASAPLLVKSAFELPAEQRATIQQVLEEILARPVSFSFELAPDLIGGIELSANGYKIAWSIADYLGSLEKGIGELLKKQNTVRQHGS